MTERKAQLLKPITVAKKLQIYLPAAPAEVREQMTSREQLAEWTASPPSWLQELRVNGPHPRDIVAARLGISIAGLKRAGVDEALTTEQIDALRTDPPAWLQAELRTAAQARAAEEGAKRSGRQ